MKEIIALDIDGTLTSDHLKIPPNVASYLEKLSYQGAEIVLITGRCFSFACPLLSSWMFPYYLAVNNGAIIIKMPERVILFTQYVDPFVIKELDLIANEENTDFFLYTGMENDDLCYYRPARIPRHLRGYIEKRIKWSLENWIEVEDFNGKLLNFLPAIKFFGKRQQLCRIQMRVEERLSLNIPVIRDPFNGAFYIAQATHPNVSKGSVVDFINKRSDAFVISAGDDFNDLSMLQKANAKIVMETAPKELKEIADVVAKPANELGIIEALENVRNHWL